MGKFENCQFQLIFISIILTFLGCASIQQPSGGPKDTQPPKVLKSTPKNLTTRFTAKSIEIQFDEFVKLSNEFTEISISPAVDKMPTFKARKQLLTVKFEEPLDSNTTYTINFGKAIADVNESNVIKNYSYVFSTGNVIDSLSISGTVRSSLTKDSLKDATVFILPVKQDSLFGKKRANIFTSTDSAGNFTIKNLRENDYLLYALKEESPDRIYNSPTEDIGFLTDTIHLSKNVTGINVSLFKQQPDVFTVKESKIENNGRVVLSFNKPLANASLQILAPPDLINVKKTVEMTSGRDSALLWLPTLTFDSLRVSVLSDRKPVDTIQINRSKRDTYNRAVVVSDNLGSGKLKPGTNPILTFSSPVGNYDITKFSILQDSVAINGLQLLKDSLSLRKYQVRIPWKSGKNYIIKSAEGAITDIFGNKSKPYTKAITLDTEENYGSIALEVTVPDTAKSYIVEWLNEENAVLRTDILTRNKTLNYVRYPTAKYKVRVIYDENKNGIWDTGNVKQRRQPELIWTFDRELTLRPNWDLEEKLIIPKSQ
jgi:hypothetical protein